MGKQGGAAGGQPPGNLLYRPTAARPPDLLLLTAPSPSAGASPELLRSGLGSIMAYKL